MKKIFTLIFLSAFAGINANAQTDTLLFENFDVDNTANYLLYNSGNDQTWVDYDVDGLADANNRPLNWFWNPTSFATIDTTGCLFSSSWFNTPANAANYLITPPIQIVDATAVLNWKSAPRQTPRYVDGYKVLVSTTDNIESSFTDTIFVAAEFLAGASSNGPNYSAYTFSDGFVHGSDLTYVEFDPASDSANLLGVLRPFSASLAQYAGQTIYIAWLHDSFDDNLIALDDILITGNLAAGVQQIENKEEVKVYPNPASERIEFSYNQKSSAQVSAQIFDVKGAVVRTITKGMMLSGEQKLAIDIKGLASGNYQLKVAAGNQVLHSSFIVK
jgi:Secretion system C-terminal sorting domain/Cleaved Adhesin Domain